MRISDLNSDVCSSDLSLFTAFIADSTQARKYITDEFQILGTAFDDRLSFILGAFYNHDKSFEPGGSHFIAFTSDPSSIPFTTSHVENKNKALYGQIGYKITEQLTLNLGGRSEERRVGKECDRKC